ncbi:MAG: hypothetical protein K8R86_05485 [Bacteroidales bacterium]|nr:hypothetical protein [Bacteroidales bacterium]
MKKHILIKLFLLSFIISMIPSCLEDDDIAIITDDREEFIGTWDVDETCNRISYQVEIIKDPSNSTQVLIKNFWLIGSDEKPPYAIVAGSTITIPSQGMCDDGSNIVQGEGVLNKKKIEWNYTVNDGADLYTCSATYERP